MLRRYQVCIALLSLALQAADLFVGGWGHRHDHLADVALSSHGECDHHDHCGHTDESSSESQRPTDHHDDCSLCRHFSQPVAPVAVEIPVVTCEHVAPLFAHTVAVAGVDISIAHPARGPPVSVA